MTCGANGCPLDASPKPSRRGYCEKHYQRWKKFGDANHLTPQMIAAVEAQKFWAEITANGRQQRGECFEWPAGKNAAGYGITTRNGERLVTRAVWVEVFGPIPPGHLVCHTCDNPPCAWPTHLFLGTHRVNSEDMVRKGRHGTMYGDSNPWTRVPDTVVRQLRKRHAEGLTFAALARETGVHPETVRQICRGLRRAVSS